MEWIAELREAGPRRTLLCGKVEQAALEIRASPGESSPAGAGDGQNKQQLSGPPPLFHKGQ